MADIVELNQGSGGAKLASYRDSGGTDWPAGVTVFAVSTASGAAVLQVVDASHGLPVEIIASTALAVTQSGTWSVELEQGGEVSLASGSSVIATQSDPANLQVTATLAGGSAVTVSGSVDLDANAEVKLASGSTVAINGTVTTSTGIDSSKLFDGSTALTPTFAKISVSSSGDNEIVAAVTGKRIRVLRWGLTANGAVAAKWRSSTTDLTGARPLTQYASAGGAYCQIGIFQTAVGEALNLNLSNAVAVGGELTYVVI